MVSEQDVLLVLKQVYDPELGINIVDLGLIYEINIDGQSVHVEMTMTTPACPLQAHLLREVKVRIGLALPVFRQVNVELVWSPEWSPMMMSWSARAIFGESIK